MTTDNSTANSTAPPVDLFGPDVCLAVDFRPKEGQLVLNLRGGPLNMSTSGAAVSKKQESNSYYYAGFASEDIHSCELHGETGNNENLDMCADIRPEAAQLNSFMLLMNGLRLLFTKTLAFSTILTVRALLP